MWKKFGKEYLKIIGVEDIVKTFEYIDEELIQNIDAADNMQFDLVENKISPDFIKLCNPEWNENISENESFQKALNLADIFWELYIKHAIAEVESIKEILTQINNTNKCYVVFDYEMPYRKVNKYINNNKVKYIIFKSRRNCYDIRSLIDTVKFKEEITKEKELNKIRDLTKIEDIIYVDLKGKLCCTKTIEGAISLIKYNEEN